MLLAVSRLLCRLCGGAVCLQTLAGFGSVAAAMTNYPSSDEHVAAVYVCTKSKTQGAALEP